MMNRRAATWLGLLVLAAASGGCAEVKGGLEGLGFVARGPGFDEARRPIPYPSGPRLGDKNIIYYHQAFSTTPYKIEDLLLEGRAAGNKKDEFARRRAIEIEGAHVTRRTEEARQAPVIYTVVATEFGEYDFAAKAFPTGLNKGIPFSLETDGYYAEDLYGTTLTNGDRLQRLAMPEKDAQRVAAYFGRHGAREVVAVVIGRVTGTSLGTPPTDTRIKNCMDLARQRKSQITASARLHMIGASVPYGTLMKDCKFDTRLVNVQVEKTEYYLRNGTLIGSTTLARP